MNPLLIGLFADHSVLEQANVVSSGELVDNV